MGLGRLYSCFFGFIRKHSTRHLSGLFGFTHAHPDSDRAHSATLESTHPHSVTLGSIRQHSGPLGNTWVYSATPGSNRHHSATFVSIRQNSGPLGSTRWQDTGRR
ncbi:hypothetical protein Hamer_G006842 [Homarus americanus]|uniref:Uncharacterized protein n=1 Tax=Homarus americanus TaxID=6706 RepID=A0A8J5N3J9_HOMAM|nr:hypothetical protein Hamer_G006842 [Homarus americanus]